MELFLKIMLIAAIVVQCVATVFALRLVHTTKYNSVWILFIIGFFMLSVNLVLQFIAISKTAAVPVPTFVLMSTIASLCMSIGVMYAHKLFNYIGRLNRQRSLFNKRILTAVLRTEEKSRSRFARELHDGMGPLLSSAKMSLTALSADKGADQQKEIISNTIYVIDEAIRSLREISNNMQPQVLNDFGLARAVRNFIDKSVSIHDIKIRFTTNLRNERFDSDVEVIMYRVICELINNSLKHSGCKSINLSLAYNNDTISLEYTDDGRGFNPSAMMDCGMGLSNISSRINSLNGTFDITSSKGRGTHASIVVNAHGV